MVRPKQIDRDGVGLIIDGVPSGTIKLHIRDRLWDDTFVRQEADGRWFPYIGNLTPGTEYQVRIQVAGGAWSEWVSFRTRGKKPRRGLRLVSTR